MLELRLDLLSLVEVGLVWISVSASATVCHQKTKHH